jgi:Calcineurin-like phosphoesterase
VRSILLVEFLTKRYCEGRVQPRTLPVDRGTFGKVEHMELERNLAMVRRIESLPVSDPLRFVIAGDTGAWADPTADGVFSALVDQIENLDPPVSFFVNLGDFAGPGTVDRHMHYLELVEPLSLPNLCVVGNHDMDDEGGPDAFVRIHGPMNFDFAYGQTRFVVLHAAPGVPGSVVDPFEETDEGAQGPREEDLAFLARVLESAPEARRVVLMHMPPYLDGHFAPHQNWGFRRREGEFLELLHRYDVSLVCCAHGLAFDTFLHEGIRFVMSGGGGTGLCSHYRGVCTEGSGHPEDRGSLFHAVEITAPESGVVSGRVIQAFEKPGATARMKF